jgi:aspartate/methionine/tyrosine aminotransferase
LRGAVKASTTAWYISAPAPSQRAALHALRRRKELAAQIVPEFSARMAYGAQRIRELPGSRSAGGGRH